MSNYGVRELTWENGQLTVHGLGGLVQPNASDKPIWTESLSGCETLESVVHQGALHSKLQSQDRPNLESSNRDGPGTKKRPYSDADLWFGFQEESLGLGQSVSASASRTDTTTMSWASYESCRSLKTARTGDKDYVRSGSETQETEGEEQQTKEETGRSCSRRGRAAAIHNESERRRRDRINQRMKTLQKLLPNGTKTDKVSILDDVIEHLKQLQAQVQFMTMRSNLPQQMMLPPMPQPPQSVLSMQHQQQQQQQFQMALLTTMARMGMGTGGAFGGGFVPPPPLMVPPMANRDCNNGSSAALSDPYSAFVAQTMNMDLYNKMAAAIYEQQSDRTTQVTTSMPSHASNHEQGD